MKCAIILVALVLAACTCRAPTNSGGPVAVADAGALVLDDAGDVCSQACNAMARHHCAESLVSRNGEPCAALCRRDAALGAASMLHPDLVADAGTHEAMRAAGVRCDGWQQ